MLIKYFKLGQFDPEHNRRAESFHIKVETIEHMYFGKKKKKTIPVLIKYFKTSQLDLEHNRRVKYLQV